MAKIFDFTAALNSRRVEKEIAVREQNTKGAIDKCITGMFEAAACGDHVGVIKNITEANRISNNAESSNMPAYCDPKNKFEGSKYNRNLSTTEIAKLIRQDIKDAQKRGTLPKTLKVSVRSEYYSGGSSIDAYITALPEGVAIHTPEYIQATDNLKNPVPYDFHPKPAVYTEAVQSYLDILNLVVNSYNMDNSDSMTDYFHVKFYGHVGIHYELESKFRKDQ